MQTLPPRDDFAPVPPEKYASCRVTVRVRLQARQENEVILFCLKGIEGASASPRDTDGHQIVVGSIREATCKAAYRLHHVARPAFDSAGSEMCADYKSAPFFRAGGRDTVQLRPAGRRVTDAKNRIIAPFGRNY